MPSRNRESEPIFEQLYRVMDSDSREVLSSGLSFNVSSRLAERWGGRLYLESSRTGDGSVFTLRPKRPNRSQKQR